VARITVKTLAVAVGVSPSTISNAYNRPDQLSAHLRQRIMDKADELGYAGPDAAGRTLRVGRADAVGVLLSERLSYAFSDPYATEFLAGLSEVLEERGISIVLMPLTSRPAVSEGPGTQGVPGSDVAAVRNASIDAMTVLSLPADHPAAVVARTRGIRLVTTDISPDPDSSWVAIDDRGAGALVGEHLAGLGHRDIAVIVETNQPAGSPARLLDPQDLTFVDYSSRYRGLRESLSGRIQLISGGHNAEASGFSAASWLLERDQTPTAIVGLSDVLALGALSAVEARGLVPGRDVSVCGFDDIPAARAAELTTVRQPIRERGHQVGRLLLDPESQPRQVLLPIRLIARTTTGPVSVQG
jgi:DNA-binding LacI/PurR family transcriptional regulator